MSKLATIRAEGTTHAVKVDGDALVDLGAKDLGEFLATENWPEIGETVNKVVKEVAP